MKADIFYVTFVKSKQFRRCQNFDDIWRALKSIATLVQSRAERFSMQNDRLAVQSRINLHLSIFSEHALTLKMLKSFGDQTVVSLNYFRAFGYQFVQHKYDAQADEFLQARQEAKDESGQG